MRFLIRTFAAACLMLAMPLAASAQGPVDKAKLMAPTTLAAKSLGDPNAPVTIIEYASLTCSHCGNFYRTTFPELKAKYIDTGKVHFILREFPLDQLALVAAMAARCGPEDKYFEIIDTLFTTQDKWAFVDQPGAALLKTLEPFGVTEESFKTCLGDETLVTGVIEVSKRGQELGVAGTPAFFINGEMHGGEMKIAEFDAVLAPLLAGAATTTE